MLSFVKSSDPSSSSSKGPTLKANERDFVQLASQEADPVVGFDEAQSPNFSIRDYVFASRSKNIQTSWPFPLPLLQLFLKHGIRNSLPPFEPPSSVRVHFRRPVDAPHSGDLILLNGEPKLTDIDSCLPSKAVVLRCSDETEEELGQSVKLTDGDFERGSVVTTHCDIGKILAWISEPVMKKCRLILKSRVILEPSRDEEMASVFSTVSDPMASNVCPVCKTFSSTSNTTLNAHMDQCLFMESYINRFEDRAQNLKVKPRKKRFMEDIYATAPHCTLEDLDRRNGRCWTSDSAAETTKVAKRHTLSQVDSRDDKSEGAVYVDSNGIKLRILSKFSDAPLVISKEEFRQRKIGEGFWDGKFISINKKKHIGAKHSKKMKFNLKNRKSNILKLFKDETHATDKVSPKETRLEQESQIQLSGEQGQISSCGTATLRRWSCSKRSDLPRKFINKGFHKSLEHPKPVSGMQTPENKQPAPSSVAKKQDVKLSRSPESIVVHSVDNVVQNKDEQNSTKLFSLEGTSGNVLHKLSRSFPRSISEDLCIVNRQMFSRSPETNKRPTGSFLLSLKTKRLSTLSKANSMNKMLRKHRSLHKARKRKRVLFSDGNSGLQKHVEAAIMGLPSEVVTEQRLHLGSSQHQDANPISSEVVDVSSVLPETVYAEDQYLPLDTDAETSMSKLMEENGKPKEQVLPGKREKQTLHELQCEGIGYQTESISAQDSSACLTNHGDMRPENAREIFSSVSAPLIPNKNNNLSINRKLSGSPASSASTISPSPNDSHTTFSDAETLSRPYTTHDKVILDTDLISNQQAQMDRQNEQLSGYHPCCCSRQNIMTGNVSIPSNPNQFPNLYIRSSITCSGSRADTVTTTPVLESHTASIFTRACSDFDSPSSSSGTPTQSSNSSFLRLMGKNLMVMNTQETSQHPKIHSPTPDSNSNAQDLPSTFAFASNAVSNHQSFSNVVYNTPVPQVANMPVRNVLFIAQTRKMNQKSCMTKEVILVDDSPHEDVGSRRTSPRVPDLHPMLPSPIAYFLPQSELVLGDNRLRSSCLIKSGSSWQCPAPLLGKPLVFQSPSTYHLQSLR